MLSVSLPLHGSRYPLCVVHSKALVFSPSHLPSFAHATSFCPFTSCFPSPRAFSSLSRQNTVRPLPWEKPSRDLSSAPSCTALSVMAASAEVAPLEVLVKAATGAPDRIGDCPFSQRVLLTLEEKRVPYEYKLVDTANKPDWFLEANPEGKVPVIKKDGKWIPDSDVIVGIIEEDFPEPSLVTPEDKASVGSALFGSFVRFLKSEDSSDGTEQALLSELNALDAALASSGGPFVAGEKLTAVDVNLSPKLFHLQTALRFFKSWALPESLTHVHAYIKALHERESFKKTQATENDLINGWKRALGK